jgi:hypothetical protein
VSTFKARPNIAAFYASDKGQWLKLPESYKYKA